jgi:hypothetical protein
MTLELTFTINDEYLSNHDKNTEQQKVTNWTEQTGSFPSKFQLSEV